MTTQKLISVTRRNWGGLIMPTLIGGLLLYGLLLMVRMAVEHPESAPGIIAFSVVSSILVLWFELIMNTLIEVEITQQTIVFRKPWKRYSLLFRKRRNSWTLSNDEWTDAYIFTTKSSYSIYFRKDRTAAFIASIEEGRKIIKEIELFFPDKKVHYNFPFEYPREIRRELKKEYPERVMRG